MLSPLATRSLTIVPPTVTPLLTGINPPTPYKGASRPRLLEGKGRQRREREEQVKGGRQVGEGEEEARWSCLPLANPIIILCILIMLTTLRPPPSLATISAFPSLPLLPMPRQLRPRLPPLVIPFLRLRCSFLDSSTASRPMQLGVSIMACSPSGS